MVIVLVQQLCIKSSPQNGEGLCKHCRVMHRTIFPIGYGGNFQVSILQYLPKISYLCLPKIIKKFFHTMINRILIRIKVLQIVFAYYQNGNSDLNVAKNELHLSLRRSYDLYYYFFLLIIEVTRLHEQRIDARKHKLRPSDEDLQPNTRLIDNRFMHQLEKNEMLLAYVKEHGISWVNETDFVKRVLDLIISSDLYAEYINNPNDSYEIDQEFWRAVFRKLICGNEEIEDALEDISIYWNDDIEIIQTFVLKTIKRFDEKNGSTEKLLPMFKDDEDYNFVTELFHQSIEQESLYREWINKHMKNWESERVANMDLVIMQVALAEIMNFPKIPIKVTLNEYIDAAKYYSTPKSGTFINGILDSIVTELKKEHLLLKD